MFANHFVKIIIIFAFCYASVLEAQCTRFPPEGVSPLFSFGHAIFPKGTKIVGKSLTYFGFSKHSALLDTTELYYSITDRVTLVGTIPIASQEPPEGICGKKTGLGDIFLQAIHNLYITREPDEFRFRINAKYGIRVPTTTIAQRTLYSFNVTNFFLGLNYDIMSNDWAAYSDFGTILTTEKHHKKFGNIILNNSGVGKIQCFDNRLYLTYFLELSNFYSRPNRIRNTLDLTTGELIVFFGPTFRLEYLTSPDPFRSILFQVGFQYVVAHKTRVKPVNDIKYILAAFLAYIF